jgi:hypothetical protein
MVMWLCSPMGASRMASMGPTLLQPRGGGQGPDPNMLGFVVGF